MPTCQGCFTSLLPLLLLLLLLQAFEVTSVAAGAGVGQMPDGLSPAGKLRAFLVCRKECIAKCDRLVYVYSAKKEFCHECLKQCISAVVQQARALGIDFNAAHGDTEEPLQGDSPMGRRRRRRQGRADERRREKRRRERDERRRKQRRGANNKQQDQAAQQLLHKN